mgnify:CR=1 FL=1
MIPSVSSFGNRAGIAYITVKCTLAISYRHYNSSGLYRIVSLALSFYAFILYTKHQFSILFLEITEIICKTNEKDSANITVIFFNSL